MSQNLYFENQYSKSKSQETNNLRSALARKRKGYHIKHEYALIATATKQEYYKFKKQRTGYRLKV